MEPEDLRKWLVKFEEGLGLILGRTEQAIRILTCYHVIEDDLTQLSIPLQWIPYSEGEYSKKPLELKAQVVDENAKNAAEDWAILEAAYDQNPELEDQIKHLSDPPLDFDVTNVARGNAVFCYRAAVFEKGGRLDIALDPDIVALEATAAGLSTTSLMQLSKKAIQPGDSGTPVLQIGGRIIGIVLGRWPPRDSKTANEAFSIYMLPFSAIPLDRYVDYQTASRASICDSLVLGHVLLWSKPAMEKVVKEGLLLQSIEDLAQLLQASEKWPSFLERFKKHPIELPTHEISFKDWFMRFVRYFPSYGTISKNELMALDIGQTEWFLKAFSSIRQGAKGLYDALYLDHALISVPPPLELWQRVLAELEEVGIFGITAPPGWGKSRLVLWIALARALKGGHAIYYVDPQEFLYDLHEYEKRQAADLRAFLRSLADHRMPSLLIIDDCHRREDENWLRAMIREVRRENASGAPYLGLTLLLLQTKQPQDRKDRAWPKGLDPRYRFNSFSSEDYDGFWEGIWKERFMAWFALLMDDVPILRMYLEKGRLGLAEKTDSPWAFVSVLVDLKELLKGQLRPLSDRIVFSMVQYGFVITNEEGLSPEDFFNGLCYLYKKAEEGHSPFVTYWEQIQTHFDDDLWESVEGNNAGEFSQHLKRLVLKWQESPSDHEQIRLLPHSGSDTSYKRVRPIKSYHAQWWTALREIWTEDPNWQTDQELLHAAQQAVLSGTPSLSASGLDVQPDTPQEWSEFLQHSSFIQDLTLRNKAFQQLPMDIRNHLRLESLDFAWNKLNCLPGTISLLEKLKQLILYKNDLTELPEELGHLSNLEILDVSDNELAALPDKLTQLTKLQYLAVSGNHLVALPKESGPLKTLQTLRASRNQLESLPDWMFQQADLQTLRLSRNQLEELPIAIGKLTNLKTIDVSVNRLKDLPEEMSQLTKLEALDASGNLFEALPEVIGKLRKLEMLDLSGKHLKTLSNAIGEMTNLQTLRVAGNQLKKLPDAIGKLRKLKELDVSDNELATLPQSLAELQGSLLELDISNNPLDDLPKAEIFQLLEILDGKSLKLFWKEVYGC
ncbi:MAG: leucine-rich repeat domain-containing protein [Candidatus Heimdallarchaeota archaeon]